MYPKRQSLAHFVVHMPLCLHDLFCAVHHLHSNWRGGGLAWGVFPQGCEDTVVHR